VHSVYEFADFRLDPADKTLRRNGTPVPLTPKVFDTLALLVENAGRLVEKERFVSRLWPDTVVEDAALAENVSRLRRALGDGDAQRLIVTVPKRGYRFEGAVRRLDVEEAPGPTEASSGAESPAARARASRWPWLALGGGVALLTLGLALYGYRRAARGPRDGAPIRALAVLPFENLSGDPGQDYFADGITDELITRLARIRALRVISRTSVMRFKGTRQPLPEIASELRVDAVVEGTHKAIEWFQQAIARDPRYASAYVGLADSYISLALAEALQEIESPRDAFPRARPRTAPWSSTSRWGPRTRRSRTSSSSTPATGRARSGSSPARSTWTPATRTRTTGTRCACSGAAGPRRPWTRSRGRARSTRCRS
jgi:DNA-binding winged helix-turn-helix (wHTH) protein